MRKRIWLVGLFLIGVLLLIFGATSVFAQEPVVSDDGGGQDMAEQCHGDGGMMGDGMMGLTGPVTLERVAGALGLTYEQLTARLTQSETIAQVAEAQGVNPSLVVATILAPHSEILQVRVKYGYLTEAQAQATLEQVRYWVEQAITAPQYGYYSPATSPTGGYTQRYAPNYGGRGWGGGQGGMMGSGTMGSGTMGSGTMGSGTMGSW